MYKNQYTINPISQENRFWAKVAITANDELCWKWLAFCNKDGYGVCRYKNKMTNPHRVSYEFFIGKIPDKLFVLHKCDNPACCNPKHLFLGTQLDNMRDMVNKGRHADLAGELNPSAKLTYAQVESIKQRYANGETNKAKLAREYDVTAGTIAHIIKGRKWNR